MIMLTVILALSPFMDKVASVAGVLFCIGVVVFGIMGVLALFGIIRHQIQWDKEQKDKI